jgi:hypothetical protein
MLFSESSTTNSNIAVFAVARGNQPHPAPTASCTDRSWPIAALVVTSPIWRREPLSFDVIGIPRQAVDDVVDENEDFDSTYGQETGHVNPPTPSRTPRRC